MESANAVVETSEIDETTKINIPKVLDTQPELAKGKSVLEHELINE